jgi:hypothetical protein
MNMSENGNAPAYPSHGTMGEVIATGLSKREAFAMAAMQGFIAAGNAELQVHTSDGILIVPARQGIPKIAVEYADALLAALEPQV